MAIDRNIKPGLLAELEKLIELPPNLISLDLRMAVDEVVTVTCTYHAVRREYGEPVEVEQVTKRYRLEEME